MRIRLSGLFILLTSLLAAQEKLEKERRIGPGEVPSPASSWVQTVFSDVRNLKWYFEETSGNPSYEAKFRRNHHHYSVEFTTEGKLEDVEILLSWDELEPSVQQAITCYFEENYRRFRVKKIQHQLSGAPKAIESFLRGEKQQEVLEGYEIIFYGKTSTKDLWEGQFDQRGTFLEKRKVILRPANNLTY